VKIHSYRELARQKIEPEVGKEVIINNKRGRIVTVTPGRVVIDFNHPLAGKTLKYKFKIIEKVEGEVDKVRAIIEMDYGKEVENFKIELKDHDIIIELPDVCKYDSNWSMAKYMIVGDIRDYVANKNVKFVEVYPKKEEPEEEKKEEEKEEKPKKKRGRPKKKKEEEKAEEKVEEKEEKKEEKPKKRGRPKKKKEEEVKEENQ